MGFSDSQHLRKMVAGSCMFLAPLLFVAAFVISPKLETSAGKQLAVAHQHLDRYYISNLIAMVELILFVPAVLGLMHMVRERQPAYGAVGGGLTMIGLLESLVTTGAAFVISLMTIDVVQPADVSALQVGCVAMAQLLRQLERICGDDHVVTHPHALRTYESDGLLQYHVTPHIAVLPGTADEVREVVVACHGAGVPWVARGAGSGLS